MKIPYRVMKTHIKTYDRPLILKAGDRLSVGERDSHWRAWVWCTHDSGISGWVPEILLRHGPGFHAEITTDYDGTELSVHVGESVWGLKILGGWVWCQNASGKEGWVPLENLAHDPS
ncbi:SH3 domain-containing protein [Sulfobacillus thermosulfidooxidans]|uniref:SH3 domain-containing protein n=1 Tax=Sulfobacillus thermosulfidooxidans TaxID=28034 RepID=UPI00096B7BF5|nr:SH3 domain-containing protein [Sulfobacillus thermosulfidooxidans]OLZ11561.1 hypothetical protein BFX05_06055 [Sulfobacillus thermosulfidooxidans]OLZ17403.1 hypothetical protein BFX06_13485 [Sulfobacillus thermosulfidooxidans]OLZ21087.1 hypothetical protein BFX07_13810 [Sulfobacillus thermosulfidooxidans]